MCKVALILMAGVGEKAAENYKNFFLTRGRKKSENLEERSHCLCAQNRDVADLKKSSAH